MRTEAEIRERHRLLVEHLITLKSETLSSDFALEHVRGQLHALEWVLGERDDFGFRVID